MSILFLIVGLAFLAALFVLIFLYMTYAAVKASPTYELKKRMRTLAIEAGETLPADVRLEIMIEMTALDKVLYKFAFVRKLHTSLDRAGLKIEVKIFLLMLVFLAGAGFLIGASINRGILPPIFFSLFLVLIPFIVLHFKRKHRVLQFTNQFANALDMMSRSLKAGHSLIAAIQMIGTEMPEPVSGLFRSVYDEQTYGLSMKDAFSHLVERMDTTDLRFFVTSVSIYREIGGNLSEILERLAHTIRERIKIRRQVRVYTAQARLSGYILALLPIAIAALAIWKAPDYIGELVAVPMGIWLIGIAVVLQIIGLLIIRRIINIRI